MLSSIGRAAIRRVGAGASHKSTNRVLHNIWNLQRVAKAYNVDYTFALRQFSLSLLRSYTTTTQATTSKAKASTTTKAKSKTKKAAGGPKKPVKKAVKGKPKRPVTAKPKAKPKKKVLTDKQKETAEKKKQAALLKALKATALTLPKGKPATAWTVLLSEAVKTGGGNSVGTHSKEAAAKYKSLTTEEMEHYNRIANNNKAENEAEYKKWINSHTPEEIHLANNARHQLKKLALQGSNKALRGSTKYTTLKDPRIPKRPGSPQGLFTRDRWNSGDFNGVKLRDAAPRIAKEWMELSPSQRQPYQDQVAANSRRYVQEYKTVFGRDPKFIQLQEKAAA